MKLVAAALTKAGTTGAKLTSVLAGNEVITGANGDERGFGPEDREGVSPDDMYFASYRETRFHPMTDDVLSTSLPEVPQ